MGGSGSGYNGAKKIAVEDGLKLTVSALVKKGALVVGKQTRGTWSWRYGTGGTFAQIGYEGNLSPEGHGRLTLSYKRNGNPVDYSIRLVATRPPYGGLRWWFMCPVADVQDKPRRCAVLYLPPGADYFASREAYKLTYQSCRDSGKFNSMFRMLGQQLGMDPATVKTALSHGKLKV